MIYMYVPIFFDLNHQLSNLELVHTTFEWIPRLYTFFVEFLMDECDIVRSIYLIPEISRYID